MMSTNYEVYCYVKGKGKGKGIPVQAFTGPESFRNLRLIEFEIIDT